MKRFLPLFILTSFLFGQDVLLHKSGKNYKGRYITKENEVIIFRVEGEKDSRMFLINDVDIIIANREGAKVELYYPFNMQNNIVNDIFKISLNNNSKQEFIKYILNKN